MWVTTEVGFASYLGACSVACSVTPRFDGAHESFTCRLCLVRQLHEDYMSSSLFKPLDVVLGYWAPKSLFLVPVVQYTRMSRSKS